MRCERFLGIETGRAGQDQFPTGIELLEGFDQSHGIFAALDGAHGQESFARAGPALLEPGTGRAP